METAQLVCAYCGNVFTTTPVPTRDGRLCCSIGCANYLNPEIGTDKSSQVDQPDFGEMEKSA